jgi:hypothetical protein
MEQPLHSPASASNRFTPPAGVQHAYCASSIAMVMCIVPAALQWSMNIQLQSTLFKHRSYIAYARNMYGLH